MANQKKFQFRPYVTSLASDFEFNNTCHPSSMSFKRPHTPTKSSTSVSSSPSPSSQSHPTKSIKSTSKSSTSNLLCTLPPTCNPPRNHPTYIANTKDLEAHYARYHAHVCESQGCGCVFPDARLLELVSLFFLNGFIWGEIVW